VVYTGLLTSVFVCQGNSIIGFGRYNTDTLPTKIDGPSSNLLVKPKFFKTDYIMAV
jgi:hypothetical protein